MKKKPNYFLKLIVCLFLIFIFFYALTNSGYYESNLSKKTILTDQKIREFERDVKQGKVINIDNYYTETKKDYSSLTSKIGKNITIKLSKGLEKIFDSSSRILKKLFWVLSLFLIVWYTK